MPKSASEKRKKKKAQKEKKKRTESKTGSKHNEKGRKRKATDQQNQIQCKRQKTQKEIPKTSNDENRKSTCRKKNSPQQTSLSILQLNTAFLTKNKHPFLQELVNREEPEIVCLQEFGKYNNIEGATRTLDGYEGPSRCNCKEKPHVNKKKTCQGLAMYMKKTDALTWGAVTCRTNESGVESQHVMVNICQRNIDVWNVYRSPSINTVFGFKPDLNPAGGTPFPGGARRDNWEGDNLESVKNTVVVGDFNVHCHWLGYNNTTKPGRQLENMMEFTGLQCMQSKETPTTFEHNIGGHRKTRPDLTFISNDFDETVQTFHELEPTGFDHSAILTHLYINTPKTENSKHWLFKKADWNIYKHYIDTQCWKENPWGEGNTQQEIDNEMQKFEETMVAAMREACPETTNRGGWKRKKKPGPNACLTKAFGYARETKNNLREIRRKLSRLKKNKGISSTEKHTTETRIRIRIIAAQKTHRKAIKIARKTQEQEKAISWKERVLKSKYTNNTKESIWTLADHVEGKIVVRSCPLKNLANGALVQTNIEKASMFATHFTLVNKKHDALTNDNAILNQPTGICQNLDTEQPFTETELAVALNKCQTGKAPGPDGIHYEFLLKLLYTGKKTLLKIYNRLWELSICLQSWRSATIIPIRKAGKDPGIPQNYRPISLTSCMGNYLKGWQTEDFSNK